MKKSIIAIAIAAVSLVSVPAMAAGYGKTVTNGTSQVSGSVRGKTLITLNETSRVSAYTPFSNSLETMQNDVTVTNNFKGNFGSNSGYTSSEWSSGALGVAYTTDSGSGWSNVATRSVTDGTKIEYSLETSSGGLFGHGASSRIESTKTTDTDAVSKYRQVDTYNFTGYDLTIGASYR